MLSVLFWNVNGRNREDRCASLVRTHAPAVLVLAECPQPLSLLAALNATNPASPYHLLPISSNCRVRIFTTLPATCWPAVEERRRYSVHRLELPTAQELLLVSVHLRSKLNTQEREQDSELRKLAKHLVSLETRRGHSRTMLIGDLNAHPFQEGVYAADGLHAMMTRDRAAKGSRTVDKIVSRFFYNPMWRFFGETSVGPPGTHYWAGSGTNALLYWYMLDQVLLRPDLLPYFPHDGVQILTSDGNMTLQKPNGQPNPDVGSDHFPILVRLNYPGV
jgi:endonuclease/exonuclease/phosphatase (EEP) superfamily protein YafD